MEGKPEEMVNESQLKLLYYLQDSIGLNRCLNWWLFLLKKPCTSRFAKNYEKKKSKHAQRCSLVEIELLVIFIIFSRCLCHCYIFLNTFLPKLS